MRPDLWKWVDCTLEGAPSRKPASVLRRDVELELHAGGVTQLPLAGHLPPSFSAAARDLASSARNAAHEFRERLDLRLNLPMRPSREIRVRNRSCLG